MSNLWSAWQDSKMRQDVSFYTDNQRGYTALAAINLRLFPPPPPPKKKLNEICGKNYILRCSAGAKQAWACAVVITVVWCTVLLVRDPATRLVRGAAVSISNYRTIYNNFLQLFRTYFEAGSIKEWFQYTTDLFSAPLISRKVESMWL